jgi:hypothetical protein
MLIVILHGIIELNLKKNNRGILTGQNWEL